MARLIEAYADSDRIVASLPNERLWLSENVPSPGRDRRESPTWTWRESLRYTRKKYSKLFARMFTAWLKRGLDVVVSIVMLVGLSPLFAVVALLIKLTDGGPVIFWQTRVGQWGREFRFPKFRSMVPDAEQRLAEVLDQNHHKSGVTFKSKNDSRLTWIGRIIRRTSLDEFPQFWSVLIGDMTLVGPRPAVPREVEKYTLDDRRRLEVKPGLTCIWQINGRGDLPFERQVELDVEYVEARSVFLDFKILFLTVPAVVSGRGAY